MDRNLRKSYECLELPITATEADVLLRQKALIKIYENKTIKTGISYDDKIGKIESSSSIIIENLKNKGIPKEELHRFDSSWKSIGVLSIIFAFVVMICFFSFYVFI